MKVVLGALAAGVAAFFVYIAVEVQRDKAACASPAAYAERIKQGSVPDCR